MIEILIVEDDFSLRESLKYALEEEGFRVSLADNGREALAKLRSAPKPNLILLDFSMPLMGGKEFMRALRADVAIAATPVVIVGASAEATDVLGARALARKPVDLDQLLTLVHKHAAI